jgi:hypothetical protein
MPKTRQLGGIAALAVASIASVAVAAPVAAADEIAIIDPGDQLGPPGQFNKLLKFDGQQAFNKIEANFYKLGTPGLTTLFYKLGGELD